ncbi:hypothetical protein [Kosakonia cowanii]
MNVIDNNEIVGRALFEPQWDNSTKRPSPGAFSRVDTSVTRKADLCDSELINILKKDVEHKPEVIVKAVGLISVEKIKQIGLDSTDAKTYFKVIESPTETNKYHAEIIPYADEKGIDKKKNVSKGISRKIGDSLELLIVNATGEVMEIIPPKA